MMTAIERKSAYSLASIFAFRMLGLFMILPVFALYGHELRGATPFLIGAAIGIYGLTQALLQLPFGMLSDRMGRKPIIITGLLLFALGSVIAAMATSIDGIILGRALQGAGAIGSTTIALLADLTQEENRTKAMAILGLTIGISFTLAMVLGPVLNQWIGVPGLFWFTALLALAGIAIIILAVPQPKHSTLHRDAQAVPALFKSILSNRELLRLDFGIFSIHAILTASFVVLPIALHSYAGLSKNAEWYLYLPVLIVAFIAMLPMIIIAEKRRKMKSFFLFSILLIALTQFSLFIFYHSLLAIALILCVFFTAFSFLEASLPSLIAKVAPAGSKGTAMGVYSSSQFLGIFVGGFVGGYLDQHFHLTSVFIAGTILAALWFAIAASMPQPRYLATHMLNLGNLDASKALNLREQLLAISGVAEAEIIAAEGVAYLKVDNKVLNKDELMAFSNVNTG